MAIGSDIRDSLPICGDCKNSKLIVWGNEVEKGDLRMTEHVEIDSEFYHFRVQCNWLKGAVPAPTCLKKCEGKQAHKE